MRIACFADVHVHNFKEFDEITGRSGSKRLDQILDTLDYIREYCVDNHIDHAVCAGDLFHVRAKVDIVVFNETHKVMKRFSDSGITTHLVAGNHDEYSNSEHPQSALQTLGEIPLVNVYEDNQRVKINNNVHLHMLPYNKNIQRMCDFINDTEGTEDEKHILCAHLGVSGAQVSHAKVPMQDSFAVEHLRPDFFQFVVLGHYHNAQVLMGTDNAFYCGSPIGHNFGDVGNKGFYVIDTDTSSMEFIYIPNPEFHTIRGDISGEQLKIHQERGDYLRIQATESELSCIEQSLTDDLSYKVEVKKEYVADTRVDVEIGMPFETIVSTYAQEFSPESEDIGLEILREAMMRYE